MTRPLPVLLTPAALLQGIGSWAQQPVVPLPRRGALERSGGSTCPLGYSASGSYCVSNPGNQRQAIPREGSICPLGYVRSGGYCLESGAR
jgi:hypothetical protein